MSEEVLERGAALEETEKAQESPVLPEEAAPASGETEEADPASGKTDEGASSQLGREDSAQDTEGPLTGRFSNGTLMQ